MKKYAILSLMAVLALGACDDDDDDSLGPSNSAEIRVVNASVGVPTASLYRGNDQLIGGVAFQSASSCDNLERIPSGQQTIEFRSTTDPNVRKSTPATFTAGQRYTVVLYGPANNLQIAVVPDQQTVTAASASNNRLRFINATTTAGDIFATATATGNPTGAATVANLGGGTGTSGATQYREIPTTSGVFRLYNVGNTTTPRGTLTFSNTGLPTSRNATIIFTDAATGGTTTALQMNECS
jgi:hypothetical protein